MERFQNACHDSSSDLEAFNELDKFSSQDFYNIAEDGGSVASSDMEINIDEPSDCHKAELSNSSSESDSLNQSVTPEPTLLPLDQKLSPKLDNNKDNQHSIQVSPEEDSDTTLKPECLVKNLPKSNNLEANSPTSTQSLEDNKTNDEDNSKPENNPRVSLDEKNEENIPCSETSKRAFDISTDHSINESPSKKSRRSNGHIDFRLQSFNNSNLLKSQSAVSTTD